MLTVKYALALCAVLVCAAGASAAKPTIVTTPADGGSGDLLAVDQVTGEVSYCILRTTGGAGGTPAGVCAKIGTATPSAANPSLVFGAPNLYNPPFGGRVFVTNVYTGQVTQCEYNFNGTTVTFSGHCAAVATIP